MSAFADRVIDRANKNQSRVIVGLDPNLSNFPEYLQARLKAEPTDDKLCETLFAFNRVVIESTKNCAVAYKPQAAFYEQYGMAGVKALQLTICLLREMGLLTIIDAKRNDVAHTAGAYAKAWIGAKHPIFDTPNPWQSDAITINGYLGVDGINPFIKENSDAGLFILVKTSNPSSGDLQDLPLATGESVAEKMAALTHEWGLQVIGSSGYSNVGMVVGATYPEFSANLRSLAPNALILMPGIGAQGGSLDSITAAAGKGTVGAYAASSRGVMYPFEAQALNGENWEDQARTNITNAAEDLRKAIQGKIVSL
ncbi:MAG: orotidine-5'-phosphate decarboxylase [Magnetococcales bacterium]|nr:orotidine-5'-phosphate decarboxylase [Magnetococcales bacterium]